jgi:hypothetical protein
MPTTLRMRIALLPALAALALIMVFGATRQAHAGDPGNLPIYTSPIDITGLRLQLVAAAPDRHTGKPVEVPLPPGLLPPSFSRLLETPLSTQLDEYWSVTKDKQTGMTPREKTCADIRKEIEEPIIKANIEGVSLYDFSCNLASKGTLVVKQAGSTLYLGYLLTNNKVAAYLTTPGTCHRNHGTPFCPDDPGGSVTFAIELVTVVRTPGLCQLTAENGTAFAQAVQIEGEGVAALLHVGDALIGGNHVISAEQAIQDVTKDVPLPLNAAFADLRNSDACTGKDANARRLLTAFSDLQTEIDLRRGVILRLSHVGITPPKLDAPNPGASPQTPSVPSFQPPQISLDKAFVTAGNNVKVTGAFFPPAVNFATALPVSIDHGGYGSPNSEILGGPCYGGATEIEWGPVGGQLRTQRLPGDAKAPCAPKFDATGLTPNTAYQFRARDCDAVTCSPWSAPLRVTTAKGDVDNSRVVLTLSPGSTLAVVNAVNDQGRFEVTVTIPAATAAGDYRIQAATRDAKATAGLQVTAAGAPRKAMLMLPVHVFGETGCPNRPISVVEVDSKFTLFGAGFDAGAVTIRIGSATGHVVGTVTAGADGSFCAIMPAVPRSFLGDNKLVAVQNGAVLAELPMKFVPPPRIA